jgi:hypothetical protein
VAVRTAITAHYGWILVGIVAVAAIVVGVLAARHDRRRDR